MIGSASKREKTFVVVDSKGRRVAPGKVLYTADQIRRRVKDLGAEIAATYGSDPHAELTIVAVMTGSMVFLADLVRSIRLPIRMGIMILTNYPGTSTKAQGPKLEYDLHDDIAGKDVLVVDDILDTGQTLAKVLERLEQRRPRSIRTCVMLKKQIEGVRAVEADFVGFEVPNEFVVGYGLDYDNLFRNYPGIAILETTADGG